MSDPNWRIVIYMMKEHIGDVMDGNTELDLLELWKWMDMLLHSEEEE